MSNIKIVDEFKEKDLYTGREGNKNIVFDKIIENYRNIINYKRSFKKYKK